MTKVLITRPAADAAGFAAALLARDLEPVLHPLMEIRPLEGVTPELDGMTALAFTSANGVRAFAGMTARRDIPVFAVGPATGATAQEYNLKIAGMADNSVESLAELIARSLTSKDHVLHIAGTHRAGDLAAALHAQNIPCHRQVLYEAKAVSTLSPDLIADLQAGAITMVTLFSPRTANLFLELCEKSGLGDAVLTRLNYACLSPAVAAPLEKKGFSRIKVAKSAQIAAMIDIVISDRT